MQERMDLINISVDKIEKKIIGLIIAIMVGLGLDLVVYKQILSDEDDEIAIHTQLDAQEDVGLLVYDYHVYGHEYSKGILNSDGSLIKHVSDNIVVLNK